MKKVMQICFFSFGPSFMVTFGEHTLIGYMGSFMVTIGLLSLIRYDENERDKDRRKG